MIGHDGLAVEGLDPFGAKADVDAPVPGNTDAVAAFRTQVTRQWFKALRRRSQRARMNCTRMSRLANRWLPAPLLGKSRSAEEPSGCGRRLR